MKNNQPRNQLLKNNSIIKQCQYCNRKINLPNHKKHEKTCISNPNKTSLVIKRTTKHCSKCKSNISKSNFKRHYNACNGVPLVKNDYKIGEDMYKCPHCNHSGNKKQLAMHMVIIHDLSKSKIFHTKKEGWISPFVAYAEKMRNGEVQPWNKGFTKYDYPQLAKSEQEKRQISKRNILKPSGAVKMWLEGKPIKGRKIYHYTMKSGENIILDSSWEVKMAKSLDRFNIKWTRPKKMILECGRSYTPDFYLVDYDVYLDPKFRENEDQNVRIKMWKKEYNKKLFIIKQYDQCIWNHIKTLL